MLLCLLNLLPVALHLSLKLADQPDIQGTVIGINAFNREYLWKYSVGAVFSYCMLVGVSLVRTAISAFTSS